MPRARGPTPLFLWRFGCAWPQGEAYTISPWGRVAELTAFAALSPFRQTRRVSLRSALRAPTPGLCFSSPQKSPPPGTARRAGRWCVFGEAPRAPRAKGVGWLTQRSKGGGPGMARTGGHERSRPPDGLGSLETLHAKGRYGPQTDISRMGASVSGQAVRGRAFEMNAVASASHFCTNVTPSAWPAAQDAGRARRRQPAPGTAAGRRPAVPPQGVRRHHHARHRGGRRHA